MNGRECVSLFQRWMMVMKVGDEMPEVWNPRDLVVFVGKVYSWFVFR